MSSVDDHADKRRRVDTNEPPSELPTLEKPKFLSKAEREAGNDPRPSLEERYGNNAGFVEAVRKATESAKAAGEP